LYFFFIEVISVNSKFGMIAFDVMATDVCIFAITHSNKQSRFSLSVPMYAPMIFKKNIIKTGYKSTSTRVLKPSKAQATPPASGRAGLAGEHRFSSLPYFGSHRELPTNLTS
jgi:hypothetical protein